MLFAGIKELNMISVLLRLLLAAVLGGLIGLEREYKRRPAGFRTHILICLGAAMTTLTSEFLLLNMHYYLDVARLGASVASGMGFIGAGTIIVTRHHRIKGLTTAAGLWTSAIVGLAAGAGFYEAAVTATVLVLLAELIFARLEYRILAKAKDINIYVTYSGNAALRGVMSYLGGRRAHVLDLRVTNSEEWLPGGSAAEFSLRLARGQELDGLLEGLRMLDGVDSVEEI